MTEEEMSEIVNQNINFLFLPKPFDGEALIARVRATLTALADLPEKSHNQLGRACNNFSANGVRHPGTFSLKRIAN
jgi:DNA-binding response OmpR family regulator